jgi:hypothetical protein
VSEETSYDVYVKSGVDHLGRDDFGTAVAHFVERSNAVALKRRLEARGERVHVERSTIYGLSESAKEVWFSDYSRIPEFEPVRDQALPENPTLSQESSGGHPEEVALPRPAAQEASGRRREPWWYRIFRE